MSYSCSDFTDSILDALAIELDPADYDSPSAQADLALAEITRLQAIARLTREPATDAERVRQAIEHLKRARDLLKTAGATRTVERVRLAITSAGGAERHAIGKQYR